MSAENALRQVKGAQTGIEIVTTSAKLEKIATQLDGSFLDTLLAGDVDPALRTHLERLRSELQIARSALLLVSRSMSLVSDQLSAATQYLELHFLDRLDLTPSSALRLEHQEENKNKA